MYRTKTLRGALTLMLLLVMLISALIGSGLYWAVSRAGVLPTDPTFALVMPLVMLGVNICLGLMIAAIISKRIIRPLTELMAATQAVANGDFSVRVDDHHAQGEFGDFIRSFNKMAEDLGSFEMFRMDFINTFSHEIKTPVVSIRGFAKLLRSSDLTDEQRDRYTGTIIRESERLADMSSNILLLSQYENTEIVSDCEPFALDEQLRRCMGLLERQWSKRGVTVVGDLEPVEYCGNEDITEQLWMNLLSNAIKFTRSEVRLNLRRHGGEAVVEVVDDGVGMDEETQRHIFDKFFKGDRSHKSEGNGLGLAIARRIVKLCGGRIEVQSRLGEGSTFSVFLPLQETQAPS